MLCTDRRWADPHTDASPANIFSGGYIPAERTCGESEQYRLVHTSKRCAHSFTLRELIQSDVHNRENIALYAAILPDWIFYYLAGATAAV